VCALVDYSHAVAGHEAHVDVNNKSVLASSVDKRRPLPIATVLCVLRDRQLQPQQHPQLLLQSRLMPGT